MAALWAARHHKSPFLALVFVNGTYSTGTTELVSRPYVDMTVSLKLPQTLRIGPFRVKSFGAQALARDAARPTLLRAHTPWRAGAYDVAIACGVVEGAGLGLNARAALIARGFAEMTRFGLARGGQAETLTGLSGLGDLVLTCSSTSSRNFSLGVGLGQGKSAAELLADRKTVAEGAFTAPVLREAAAEAGVDMPVTQAVNALLEGAAVQGVVEALLARPLREEAR